MLMISRDIGISNIGSDDELLLCHLSCGSPRVLVKITNTFKVRYHSSFNDKIQEV